MTELKWWQTAVFYQIYPRSFADGNGDGIGDFRGMIQKLDYLQSLGIDALWLSPHFPSPQFDCGYDISDYRGVAPEYGTLEDFKEFLAGAHARGMRVILDMVLNHTSDQHPWFIESRSSRDNPKRDWYIWHDGKNGGPPNNWGAAFDTSSWEYDETTGQYYYHYFFKQQPDLNWRNPMVRQAMWDAVRFWLDLGVDGYRLDALGTIFEDPALPDHTVSQSMIDLYKEAASGQSNPIETEKKFMEMFKYQVDLPEVQALMKDLRRVIDEYPDRMLVGENEKIEYYGDGTDELHLIFNFPLMQTPKLTPAHIRANQEQRLSALPPLAWPCNTLGNHDSPRVKTRFGDGQHDDALARLWLALILTLKGTPFLYNGEEIGMTNYLLENVDQVRDNLALFFYENAMKHLGIPPEEALKIALNNSRDQCRTPLQWTAQANAGFSPAGVQTWLPLNPNYQAGVNVADQDRDPASLLNFYRRLLALRKAAPALIAGEYSPLHPQAEEYFAFLRTTPQQTCLVVLNLSEQPQILDFSAQAPRARRLYASAEQAAGMDDLSVLQVQPFGFYIGELKA
jgi:alpha-glucosidase